MSDSVTKYMELLEAGGFISDNTWENRVDKIKDFIDA